MTCIEDRVVQATGKSISICSLSSFLFPLHGTGNAHAGVVEAEIGAKIVQGQETQPILLFPQCVIIITTKLRIRMMKSG